MYKYRYKVVFFAVRDSVNKLDTCPVRVSFQLHRRAQGQINFFGTFNQTVSVILCGPAGVA